MKKNVKRERVQRCLALYDREFELFFDESEKKSRKEPKIWENPVASVLAIFVVYLFAKDRWMA